MKKKSFLPFIAGTVMGVLLLAQPAKAQKQQKLSDAEIASIAVVANQIDISNAQVAKSKSKKEDVLQFAQTMATDHKAVLDKATALVTKLGVTPKENDLSKQLMVQSGNTIKMLQAKQGSAFDRAYIDNEVAYHKAVISLVGSRLIPEAQNSALKAFLQSVAPAFEAHLKHAEMLQEKMKK